MFIRYGPKIRSWSKFAPGHGKPMLSRVPTRKEKVEEAAVNIADEARELQEDDQVAEMTAEVDEDVRVATANQMKVLSRTRSLERSRSVSQLSRQLSRRAEHSAEEELRLATANQMKALSRTRSRTEAGGV